MFTEEIETQIKAVNFIDGDWYIRLEGDFAGRVTGAVYDGTQQDLVEMPVTVSDVCRQRPALFTAPQHAASCTMLASCSKVQAVQALPACSLLLQDEVQWASALLLYLHV